ncbi:hypothetical protein Sjap_023113 [Stephania japonica]|uniref:RanBP2-type domain-containing protein n=1 Tax=Stephania japonica TaxID=461633 RepID=A0AAP0EQN2_9MAGN
MSQVDNRNSSAAKRARTDGSRREDDWTCPSCGNVNFSFRTTCNMRTCTQSRPAHHNSKSAAAAAAAAKPLQAPPHNYTSSTAYLASAAPSSMYLTLPPYASSSSSSLFNGTSLPPPYDLPFSGGSGYHYDYANRLSTATPYAAAAAAALHLSAPTPYSAGSILGTAASAGMYGIPPLMDRYGLPLPMPHARPGIFPNENPPKNPADGTRDTDWTCPNCGNVNFSFRTVCNMRKCNTPKPGSQGSKFDKGPKQKMPEGSWKCNKCNNINYPFRTKCNRQNCGAEKPSELGKSPAAEVSEGDDQSESCPGRRHVAALLVKLLCLLVIPVELLNPLSGMSLSGFAVLVLLSGGPFTFQGNFCPSQLVCYLEVDFLNPDKTQLE